MPVVDTLRVYFPPMETLPPIMELRHNDVAVGRVASGAVEPDDEEPHAQARFWMGVRGIRARIGACTLPPMHIVFAAASSKPTG